MTERECNDQMRPKLNSSAIHTIDMFGGKIECIQTEAPHTYCQIWRWVIGGSFWRFLLPVVQGHHLRLIAQWIPQSTRNSCQTKTCLPLLWSWDFAIGRLSNGQWLQVYIKTYTEMVKSKQQPVSAMAISVSKFKLLEKSVVWTEEVGPRILMILKTSACNSQNPPNVFSNLITNYRKRSLLSSLPGVFAESIKPGMKINVEPVFWGNCYFIWKK